MIIQLNLNSERQTWIEGWLADFELGFLDKTFFIILLLLIIVLFL